jgi:hypothetical protein
MGKKTDNHLDMGEKKSFRHPKVRMAYSLNNYQPVQCTLISDQPFFYIDEEVCMDEDIMFGEELMADVDALGDFALEEQLLALQAKIETYERNLDRFAAEQNNMFDFEMAGAAITGADEPENITLNTLREALGQSRMASALYEAAQAQDIELTLSYQVGSAAYDKAAKTIFVRPDLNKHDAALLCVRELRRVWQDLKGAGHHPLIFQPDQAVLVNRAQAADLSVAMIRAAWEMKLAGNKAIWHHVENSSMADLGRALAREALVDFRSLNNGKAGAAVFETWFLSERCREQDRILINAMLADYKDYVQGDYSESVSMSREMIAQLGAQPFGKNYLAPYAGMIVSDTIFTEIRDRSNANFLWFIKFERSFSKAEEESLQSAQIITTTSGHRFDPSAEVSQNGKVPPSPQKYKSKLGSPFPGDNSPIQRNNVIHVCFSNGESESVHLL